MTKDRSTLVTLKSENIATLARVRISEIGERHRQKQIRAVEGYMSAQAEISKSWWFKPLFGYRTLIPSQALELLENTRGSDLEWWAQKYSLFCESGSRESLQKRLALLRSAAEKSEQMYLSLNDFQLLTREIG